MPCRRRSAPYGGVIFWPASGVVMGLPDEFGVVVQFAAVTNQVDPSDSRSAHLPAVAA